METRGRRRWALCCVAVLSAFGATAEEVPELKLLEFMSDWQDDDGGILEPSMFDDQVEPDPNRDQEFGDLDADN